MSAAIVLDGLVKEYRQGVRALDDGPLGRRRNAVSSWERGLTLPNVPRLLRMAKMLNTLAESLYMEFYSTFPSEVEGHKTSSL